MRTLVVTVAAAFLLAAAPASAEVRVVPQFDLAEYEGRAAIGFLVPTGEPLLELGSAEGPEILVALPPAGRSEADRRYPIALIGGEGLLTSGSTRIDGLVTIADVAAGRLESVPSPDPSAELELLDERIERNDRIRLPLTIALAAVLIGLALVRPMWSLRALLVALAANLWLSPLLALAAGVAALVLPLGWACAAVLAFYLTSLGLDAETVALSPYGPSQVNRFYGINNLLGTLLLVPALVGTALLGRAGIGVAALALVTVGGNRFGADGGGLLVLVAGFGVLAFRLLDLRLTLRTAAALAAAVVALGLAFVALDAATGGESHVTDALSGGPAELAGDLADRVERSVRRTLDSPGALVVVLGGLAVLAGVVARAQRTPVLDAFLVALAVSLVVNDTPSDVVGLGAAAAFALARAGPWLDRRDERAFRPVFDPFLESQRR